MGPAGVGLTCPAIFAPVCAALATWWCLECHPQLAGANKLRTEHHGLYLARNDCCLHLLMTLWGTRSHGLFINGLFINDVTGWGGVPGVTGSPLD